MKLYVASSWRNTLQPSIVALLRGRGHEVYDFRNPRPGVSGFDWSEIDERWQQWSAEAYKSALSHPLAELAFRTDFEAMEWADAFVLVLPCGRSSHLEAGWAIGRGKPTAIYLDGGEPELMNKKATKLITTEKELFWWALATDAALLGRKEE